MFSGRATTLVFLLPLWRSIMYNYSSGDVRPHPTTKQSNLFRFDSSPNLISISYDLNTTTEGNNFHNNSAYHRSCKKIYSLLSDPCAWRIPEEPDDCSRADLKRAYRLGEAY